MKKILILSVTTLSILLATAQTPPNLVPGQAVYSVDNAGNTRELKLTGDSLLIVSQKETVLTPRQGYHVENIAKIDNYEVLYVQYLMRDKNGLPMSQLFGVFIIHAAKAGSPVKILQNLRWFNTLEAAQFSLKGVTSFEEAYFDTWYPREIFASLTAKPGVATLDQKKMQTIINEWAAMIRDGAQKLAARRNDGLLYGPRPWQYFLSDLLIKYKLSPLASVVAVNEKAGQLGVRYPLSPNLRSGKQTVRVTDTVREQPRPKQTPAK